MPSGLRRLQATGRTHFVIFTCHRRAAYLARELACESVLRAMENMRRRYRMRVYGFVLMPEHVHVLLSEPEVGLLSTALQSMKSSSARMARSRNIELSRSPHFWQTRYYDRYMRDYAEFAEKLRYIHRNPVKRGLCARPEDWRWSSFRHYATGEYVGVEIESRWLAKERESAALR